MLLRASRRAYSTAIRGELLTRGMDDLPRHGPYVVQAVARSGMGLSEIANDLAVSKQAASKLIDLLVNRGFLERTEDRVDRRRIALALTPRGEDALEAAEAATNRVNKALTEALSAEELAGFKAGLDVLVALSETYAASGTSRPAPSRAAYPRR